MKAPVKNTDYAPIEAGTYIARCYSVVDLGTHNEEYQGTFSDKQKVRITWELPTETKEFTDKDGNTKTAPLVIGKEYTLSMGSKANLRKDIQSMIGAILTDAEAEAFEIFDLVGMECQLSIAHKTSKQGKEYAVVQSIAKLMKGTVCPPQFNPSVKFDINPWNQAAYDALPEFIRKKIDESYERKPQASTEGEELDF